MKLLNDVNDKLGFIGGGGGVSICDKYEFTSKVCTFNRIGSVKTPQHSSPHNPSTIDCTSDYLIMYFVFWNGAKNKKSQFRGHEI
jgi:hypothetical protein